MPKKSTTPDPTEARCASAPHTPRARGGEPIEVTFGQVTVRTTAPDPARVRKNIEESGDKLEKLLRVLETPGVTLRPAGRVAARARSKRKVLAPRVLPSGAPEDTGEA